MQIHAKLTDTDNSNKEITNNIMLCFGITISFKNMNFTQIQHLANKKYLNLDLNQIHCNYKSG